MKRMENLVSVVMPVYNTEPSYLQLAISSILNQTYSNIELILVDSSTDQQTIAVIDKENPRIKYYWVPKNGIANALNFGIEKAQGSYIARMDADDISLPTRIEKQVSFLEQNPQIVMVGTQFEQIDQEGVIQMKASKFPISEAEIKADLFFGNAFAHPSVMMRRGIFDSGMHYNTEAFAEDYDLWTQIVRKYSVANLQEVLIQYRSYGENVSQKQAKKMSMSVSRSSRRYIEQTLKVILDKFDIDQTAQYFDLLEQEHRLDEYVIEQLGLLGIIWRANVQEKFLQKEQMDHALMQRLEKIHIILNSDEALREQFIECYKHGGIANEKLREAIKEKADARRTLLSQSHQYILYGLGLRGIRFLARTIEQNNGWERIGVSDRDFDNAEKLSLKNEYISVGNIVKYEGAIIIVTPAIYHDISRDLVNRGIDKDHIISMDSIISDVLLR